MNVMFVITPRVGFLRVRYPITVAFPETARLVTAFPPVVRASITLIQVMPAMPVMRFFPLLGYR